MCIYSILPTNFQKNRKKRGPERVNIYLSGSESLPYPSISPLYDRGSWHLLPTHIGLFPLIRGENKKEKRRILKEREKKESERERKKN